MFGLQSVQQRSILCLVCKEYKKHLFETENTTHKKHVTKLNSLYETKVYYANEANKNACLYNIHMASCIKCIKTREKCAEKVRLATFFNVYNT